MGGKVLVSLLVSSVLGDAVISVSTEPDAMPLTMAPPPLTLIPPYKRISNPLVEVLSSNDDSVGHLGRVDDTVKNSASNRDVASEGALLVDVGAVDGL